MNESMSMGNIIGKLMFGTIGEDGEVSKLQELGPIHSLEVDCEEPEEDDSVKALAYACGEIAKCSGAEVGDVVRGLKQMSNADFTSSCEIQIKGISRKRLKKLLMSRVGRNAAEKIVWEIWKRRGFYTMLDTWGWF